MCARQYPKNSMIDLALTSSCTLDTFSSASTPTTIGVHPRQVRQLVFAEVRLGKKLLSETISLSLCSHPYNLEFGLSDYKQFIKIKFKDTL